MYIWPCCIWSDDCRMVECITFPNGDLLLINEEGKLIGLPLNPEATALWRATFDNDNFVTGRKDFVVGPAILIKKDAPPF